MLSTKFRFIWPVDFIEDFLEINQSETRIACVSHVWMRFAINEPISHKEIPEKKTKFSLPELYNSKIQFHVLY
jgi:hypothetical protein